MEIDPSTTNAVQFPSAPFVAPAAQQQPSFGLVVPGFPLRTDFVQVDSFKFALTLELNNIASIRELVLFFLPSAAIPPQHGVLCYWQVQLQGGQSTGFEILGALTADHPSGVFPTGWSEHEQVSAILENVQITVGLSLEPLSNIQNIGLNTKVNENKLIVAQKVALDLFRFMQSFDKQSTTGHMVVPTNIFDRWFQRFENRFRRDPNFFLKTSDEI